MESAELVWDGAMTQALSADKLTLYDLEQRFGLHQIQDESAFPETQDPLPELTETDRQRLQRIEAAMANLEHHAVLENTVKLAVIAPLMDLAGLFLPPFYVSTEESIELVAQAGSEVVRGRIDILVLKDQFWILVIESKRAEFSVKAGIPQILAYMLAAPRPDLPVFGWVTNGIDFVFVKVVSQNPPQFARSRQFVIGQDDGLAQVLQIIRKIASPGIDHDSDLLA